MKVKLYQPEPTSTKRTMLNSFDSCNIKLQLKEISENPEPAKDPTSIFDNTVEMQRKFNKNPPKYLSKNDFGVRFHSGRDHAFERVLPRGLALGENGRFQEPGLPNQRGELQCEERRNRVEQSALPDLAAHGRLV